MRKEAERVTNLVAVKKRGFIFLININERIISSRRYRGWKERMEIINDWKRIYPSLFRLCHIHIIPEVDCEVAGRDGTDKQGYIQYSQTTIKVQK